jgi:ribosomal RNA-processing protein 8
MARKTDDTTNSKNKKNNKKRKQTVPSEEEPNTNTTTTSKEENDPGTWSKSKKKRMRAMRGKQVKTQQKLDLSKKTVAATLPATTTLPETTTTNSNLHNAFRARLTGSRFRSLNEELYTKESKESFERFSEHPELFEQYHEGFRHQVASWPVNPVNVMLEWITFHFRQSSKEVVVADFGCGDAQLAKDLMQLKNNNNNKDQSSYTVHSFDLVSQNELVTACDMAHVPLENKSVDAVVFCLALMGTNLADFIREAHRVLKDNGRVKIAEVRSRIEYSHSNSNSNKEQQDSNGSGSTLTGTLKEFLQVLSNLGFEISRTDRSNKMFLYLELKKNGKTPNKKLEFSAKPCIYKRR